MNWLILLWNNLRLSISAVKEGCIDALLTMCNSDFGPACLSALECLKTVSVCSVVFTAIVDNSHSHTLAKLLKLSVSPNEKVRIRTSWCDFLSCVPHRPMLPLSPCNYTPFLYVTSFHVTTIHDLIIIMTIWNTRQGHNDRVRDWHVT